MTWIRARSSRASCADAIGHFPVYKTPSNFVAVPHVNALRGVLYIGSAFRLLTTYLNLPVTCGWVLW